MRIPIALLLILALGAGCAGGSHSGGGPLAANPRTVSPLTLEDLAAGKRDCLQYRVARFADGTEDWNSDWVFFSLIRTSDSKLVLDAKEQPLASGLLYSQADRFMKEHPMIAGTAWCYRVKRMKRHLKDGQVLAQSEYVTLDDVDLNDLLRKDRLARVQ